MDSTQIDNEPDDLRATLESAMIEAKEQQAQELPETEESAPLEQPEATEEPNKNAANALEATEKTEPTEEVIKAPESWKAEAKQHWDKVPPELKKMIAEREQEVHRGFTRMDEERQFGRQIKEVVNPYMPIIASKGGNAASVVQNLLNTSYILETASPEGKIKAIQSIAKDYGIDLAAAAQESQNNWVDPNISALQNEIQQLKSARNNEDMQRNLQIQQQAQNDIVAFSADPKNVHFETVRGEMAALMQSGLASGLQDAYDKAVWANPAVRSMLITQQNGEANRNAVAKAKVTQAKRAGASITGGPGHSTPGATRNGAELSLRDELQENFRATIGGRI